MFTEADFYPLKPDKEKAELCRKNCLIKKLTENGYSPDSYIISNNIFEGINYISYYYFDSFFHIRRNLFEKFTKDFEMYISGEKLVIDNLINLLIMVKNAGEEFREVLRKNKPFIDHWTFLDTGSTDNTVNIILEEMKGVPGKLYQEPFINFRESRNRLLDLAGDKCSFNIFLDDTYYLVDGKDAKLRDFLHLMRGEPSAESFSLYIRERDLLYTSNRISIPEKKLRYIYRVHEILKPNKNFLIPERFGLIISENTQYMNDRTKGRKQEDLRMLLEDFQETPDGRLAYYIAETYLYLQKYSEAVEWYLKRLNFEGYSEEKYDSYYKIAVLYHQFLNKDWPSAEIFYISSYEMVPDRPEPLYMIGTYYKNNNFFNTAFIFLKKAFDIGSPVGKNYNMNLKTEMYNFHLPKDFMEICYLTKNYEEGLNASQKYNFPLALRYRDIFSVLINMPKTTFPKTTLENTICFVTKGGWHAWDGSSLYDKGLGGSETTMIKYAEELCKRYRVLFFCPCVGEKTYNKVEYYPIELYQDFLSKFKVEYALINRYAEYIPVTCLNEIPCYFMIHDLFRESEYIIDSPFLKGILCPTNWCCDYAKNSLPSLTHKVKRFSYGVEKISEEKKSVEFVDLTPYLGSLKKPRSFIYPSFPNRGLSVLLKMWDRIIEKYPDATLNIFCDFENSWLKQNWVEETETVKNLLEKHKNSVKNHGWVSKQVLSSFWEESSVWLYPCTFTETACLTCMEAFLHKCLVITNDLGALVETGSEGVIVKGNASSEEWQNKAFEVLCDYLDNPEKMKEKIEKGYQSILKKNYKEVTDEFFFSHLCC